MFEYIVWIELHFILSPAKKLLHPSSAVPWARVFAIWYDFIMMHGNGDRLMRQVRPRVDIE